MASLFSDMTSSSNFFNVLFALSTLVTDPSFMSVSSLVLELWQFLFIRDWPEIRKLEIPQFCPISGDWGELGIPNSARTSLVKCYWILQNARVTDVEEHISNQSRIHVVVLSAENAVLQFQKGTYAELDKNSVHLLRRKCYSL